MWSQYSPPTCPLSLSTPSIAQATIFKDAKDDHVVVESTTLASWGEFTAMEGVEVSFNDPSFADEEDKQPEKLVIVVSGYEVQLIQEATLDSRILNALECEAVFYRCICSNALAY